MILIVGGAGYIGAHVNKALTQHGYSTLVYDSLVCGHKELVKWGNFIKGDLADIDHLRLVFKAYPIRAVMHFAAFTYVGESCRNPRKYYNNNVTNTLELLHAMLEADVRKIIFSSTCAIYGHSKEIPITEKHQQLPINPYGQSKLMVEKVLNDYCKAYGLNYVSLRYFNAAGADPDAEIGECHDPETHLIPLVLDVAAGRRECIRVFGTDYQTPDGTCIRDYIHVSDLAQAHVKALEYLFDGGTSETFNLGNGTGFSVREVIEQARKVTSRHIKTVEVERRPGDPPALVGSVEKAQRVLKWTAEYQDLATIIQTAWKWHTR